jgi:hypothetical protein
MAGSLTGLAALAADDGRPLDAVRFIAAADALECADGAVRAPNNQRRHERLLAAARSALDDDAFAAAWADGHAMAPEEAIAAAIAGGSR